MVLRVHVVLKGAYVSREGYRYAALLLLERQRALAALEVKYRGTVPPPRDYFSCRRSLVQAINQLETLLGTDSEAELASDRKELKE